MNAGTRSGEMKDVVRQVELATADGSGFVSAAASSSSATGRRACRPAAS